MNPINYTQGILRSVRDLEEEGGITEISVKNYGKLFHRFGMPAQLDFKADQRKGDYVVIATWEMPGGIFTFTFTGFAWGYRGTAPTALDLFLTDVGAAEKGFTIESIPLDDHGKTDCSWRRDGKFTA